MILMSIVFFIFSVVCFVCSTAVKVYRARHYPVSMDTMTAEKYRKDARLSDLQFKGVYTGVFFLVSALIMLLGWIT